MMTQLRNFRKGRRVCGTLNTPSQAERTHFQELCTDDGHDPRVKFLVFQTEVAPTTGTIHIQYYCIFSESVRARQAHAILGARVHFDLSRGTPAQNRHYCLKPHDGCDCHHCEDARAEPNLGREVAPGFITGEYGIMRRPRNDKLEQVVEMMDTGSSLAEVLGAHPKMAIMYGSRIQKEFLRRLGDRDWAMEILIYVGETGTGKSTTAKLENPGSITIPWPVGGHWWFPMYTGQECVVLDDFRSANATVLDMMKLFDRHAWTVEDKGCHVPFVSRKIVITTNVDPREWYQLSKVVETRGEQARQTILRPLARRISEFATIYDFAPGHVFPNFVKVARPKGGPEDRLTWFKFNDSIVADFGREAIGEDRGDQFEDALLGHYRT